MEQELIKNLGEAALGELAAAIAARTKPLARFPFRFGTLLRFEHGVLGAFDSGRLRLWPTSDGQVLERSASRGLTGLRLIGVEEVSRNWRGRTRTWSPIFRNHLATANNHLYQPASLWRQIATGAAFARNADAAQLAADISHSFAGASVRLRDLAENYTNFFTTFRNYATGSEFGIGYGEEVSVNAHSFLVELCTARDRLAEYLAGTRFNRPSVDSMARLREILEARTSSDVVRQLILEVTDSASPQGWMARLSRYRNIIVHRTPLRSLPGAESAQFKDLAIGDGEILKSISINIPDDPCAANEATCDLLDRCSELLTNMAGFSWRVAIHSAYPPMIQSLGPLTCFPYTLTGADPWSGQATLPPECALAE